MAWEKGEHRHHKEPVEGRVRLRKLNLDGGRQADLTVHGGADKAVYCYPVEHYAYWKKQLPGHDLRIAIFGENFTTEGLQEESVHLGDRFAIGSAEMVVTQPRLPCYKLGIRFESDDMVKKFLNGKRYGYYLNVTKEGEVGMGDEIKVLSRDPNAVSVSEITRLYVAKRYYRYRPHLAPQRPESLRAARWLERLLPRTPARCGRVTGLPANRALSRLRLEPIGPSGSLS